MRKNETKPTYCLTDFTSMISYHFLWLATIGESFEKIDTKQGNEYSCLNYIILHIWKHEHSREIWRQDII